jgi:hypothetical protein
MSHVLNDLDVMIERETQANKVCQDHKITVTKRRRKGKGSLLESAKLGDTV